MAAEKQKLAEVIALYPSNFRDVAETLRVIAADIDAGEYGDVGSAALVIKGNTLNVFGAGRDSDGGEVALLLQAGALRLIRAVERDGQ